MGNKRSARLRGLEWLGSKIPLTYKTPKFIKVDVPIVAIFHRTCQGMAFALALLQLYMNDGWAYAETPGGMANAWDEPGSFFTTTDDPSLAALVRLPHLRPRAARVRGADAGGADGQEGVVALFCDLVHRDGDLRLAVQLEQPRRARRTVQ